VNVRVWDGGKGLVNTLNDFGSVFDGGMWAVCGWESVCQTRVSQQGR